VPEEGDHPTEGGGQRDEDEKERIDRELIELLNELRVALPGVQVLFAFLLTVPFAQGFAQTTDFQRDLYFGVLGATAVSSALLIAPSALHRINFRQHLKKELLFISNGLAIAGLGFLALAIIGAVTLIADFAFSGSLAWVAGIVAGVLLATLWVLLPLALRMRGRTAGG
jgi:hypothetical protein